MPSMIAMSNPDGTYTGVYVHEPFAPQVLIGSYMQRGKARRMINLGDLITLTGDPATCVAYRRDHGQPLDQTDQFGPVNLAAIIFQRDLIAFDAGPLHEDFGESAKGLGETGGYHIIVHGR